jgi:formiminotetrahydrofolate cyclodeaminase
MLLEKRVAEFIAETASSSPAPGGGSASALAGALGTALAEMVINLTVGKKKYADVAQELADILPPLMQARKELERAVDDDTAAFKDVMKAYGLPKETEAEKTIRSQAILQATIGATKIPLSVMQISLHALKMTKVVAEKGNRNSLSDAGVAALLLEAAISGAALNVRINLPGIGDHPFAVEARQQMEQIENQKQNLAQSIKTVIAAEIR